MKVYSQVAIVGVCLSLFSSALSAAVTWDGNGAPNSSGSWNAAANWDSDASPTANSAVILGDVTSGARTVTFDATGLTINSLTVQQLTDGGSNYLAIPYQSTPQTLTVTQAISLGTSAANATAGILITGPSASSVVPALNALGGLTVSTGGVMEFRYNATPANFTAFAGNLTIHSGGLVRISAPASTGTLVTLGTSAANSLANNNTLTIDGGTLRVENSASGAARLAIAENLNWSSGKIQFYTDTSAVSGQYIILRGATNTIGSGAVFERVTSSGATAAAPDLSLQIAGSSSAPSSLQTLDSAVTLGAIRLFENASQNNNVYYTHRISSTAAGQGIGQVTMTSYGANNVFQLGSNLNSTVNNVAFITSDGSPGGLNARIFRVDLNGYTFDGTASVNGWTPNRMTNAPSANSTWEVTSSVAGGVLKATKFNFALSGALAGDALKVGAGAVLEATGGNGTANVLTGTTATYVFDSASTFRYSGNASSLSAATVQSAVAIGLLDVRNGALRVAQSSFTAAGGATVSSGGVLDLNGSSAGVLQLGVGKDFSMHGGKLLLGLGDNTVLDQIIGSGGSFSLIDSEIVLTLGSGFDYELDYQLLSGFSSSAITNLSISGYDTTQYHAELGLDGTLSFSSVPEPSVAVLTLSGFMGLLVLRRRRLGSL